jgi:hypothetical protein
MISFQVAEFLPDTLQVVFRDTDGFSTVIEGSKLMVKKMGPRLAPRVECPDCKGGGETWGGDICRSCAGMGYTRTGNSTS